MLRLVLQAAMKTKIFEFKLWSAFICMYTRRSIMVTSTSQIHVVAVVRVSPTSKLIQGFFAQSLWRTTSICPQPSASFFASPNTIKKRKHNGTFCLLFFAFWIYQCSRNLRNKRLHLHECVYACTKRTTCMNACTRVHLGLGLRTT